jgi:energy-coupling factor transporter ATP-binding protein EcfA2
MTNAEKWRCLTANLCSPNNYIDWAWRFIIAASLQRRVAFSADPKDGNKPLFPNMYMVLFGEPGIGKSLVLDSVKDILKHHKRKDVLIDTSTKTEQEKMLISSIEKSNLDAANDATQQLKKGGERIEPALFPYAPDATTYESLVNSMGNSFMRINYNYTDKEGNPKLGIYGHCSMYFCLDELGSLFRKHVDLVIHYLLGLHACPLDYEYKTKTQGQDRVRRGCLNFIAGTTPDFMEEISQEKLIGKGFTARVFFICATKNRKNVAFMDDLNAEQHQCRTDILEHIKKLACLYGEVKIDIETKEFIRSWWDDIENNKQNRPNKSPKLNGYYARKNIAVYKIAMAEHFSESTDMFIPLEVFKRAIEISDREELTMHQALTTDADNPLTKVTERTLNYIRVKGKITLIDLIDELWGQLPQGKKSMDDVISYLEMSNQITHEEVEDKTTGRIVIYYKPI